MPRPSKEQLKKINKFAHTELEEDQVYVFRSLSADTLPVKRYSWFGEYSITMNNKMLNSLKKSYRQGVGLLASHNNSRLPFGRTFDAEVTVDMVDGDSVETMYVDHYVVTHVKGEDGEKIPLQTEINGMTTQDIVNHIDVGHTFDTSIGFSMSEMNCSICKHDIRDRECRHIPGGEYEVQNGDKTENVRCNIIAADGEGLENSLVYAGAVDRAIITHGKFSESSNENHGKLQQPVNNAESTLYNVDDLKTVPLQSQVYVKMSKGSMEMFTTTPDRTDIDYSKGSVEMPVENTVAVNEVQELTTELAADVVSLTEYSKVVGERDNFSAELDKLKEDFATVKEELATKTAEVESLAVKSELADKFTQELRQEVIDAGVKARGNAFSKDRYQKYADTLSVDELKEELQAFKEEFPGTVEAAQITKTELEEDNSQATVELSKQETRELAAKNALSRYQKEGGDLEELTREELAKLSK